MFRTKILVRAKPPFSTSSSPFLLLDLRLDLDLPPSSSSEFYDPGSSSVPHLFVKIETLCWKLSRAWGIACICFPQSPNISIIYQRSQSKSVERVVKELAKELPIGEVGPEEELTSSSLVTKALECALRCAFLARSWRCLGNSLFVDSDFSCNDERNHLCALDVRLQLEMDDGFLFLVSPDVVRFSRYQISELLNSEMELTFCNGEEVSLENNSRKFCYALPSLDEGSMIGLRKVLPFGEDICQHADLWFFKHGLALPDDYFIKIQFTFGGEVNEKWFPSFFVLQGSGLAPAPQTSRIIKAASALDAFMKVIEGWNLFDQGLLKVQVASSLNVGSEIFSWTKAADALKICVSRTPIHSTKSESICCEMSVATNLISANDFRAPKPGSSTGYRRLDQAASLENISASTSKISVKDASAHVHIVPPLISSPKIRPLCEEYTISLGKQVCKTHPSSCSPGKTRGIDDNEGSYMTAEAYISDESKISIEKQQSKFVIDDTSLRSMAQETTSDSLKQATNKRKKICTSLHHREEDTADDNNTKKRKVSSVVPDFTAKVIDCHERGQLESLTVAELKSFLTSKRVKVGGRKKDLIQRVKDLLA